MTESSASPSIDGLFDLACRSGVDIRPTLLRVLTDLYVQTPSHSPEETAQYVELASRLIEHVDAATRATVACRLATYRHAPPKLLARLGQLFGEDPPAAEPAPQVIASPSVIPDPLPVALPAAEEAKAGGDDLAEAFFSADIFERRLILLNLDAVGTRTAARPPAPETCRRLEAAALAGDVAEFSRILGNALLLPPELAERIAADPLGEPIVVAARALAMPAEALQRVLLFVNPAIGQSVERVYELANLYDEVTPHAAETMIAIWRGVPLTQRRPAHQPALYDDETRSARAASTTSRYRSARRSDALAARFKSSGR
jgi:hypothetical protein